MCQQTHQPEEQTPSALASSRHAISSSSPSAALRTLRAVLLLTGSARVAELRRARRVLGPRLRAWLAP
jgi:hypothetical protein